MKYISRLMSVIVCICLIFNMNICLIPTAFADTETADAAAEEYVQSVEASGGIDWSELSGSHDIDRYENNEVAVLYRDGKLEVLKFGSRDELAAGLKELAADETVEIYQPNFQYKVDTAAVAVSAVTESGTGSDADDETVKASRIPLVLSDDRFVNAQWYLRNDGSFTGALYPVKSVRGIDTKADWAWYEYEPKRQVTVAVIDTGIDRWELDLAGRVWENTDEIQGNGIDDDENGYIDDRWGWNFFDGTNVICKGSEDDHGTHCASVIAAKADNGYGIKGIAHYDNIKVMSVKALGGRDGHGTTDALVNAIKYAEDNGAQICNFSLGTETDDFIMKKTVLSSRMLFVAAAGNSTGANIKGLNIDHHATYPAAYGFGNVITVANLAADGRLHTSSDYGMKTVHLAAPGTDIAGATVGDGFVYMTGTSMAAPMVTAAAALVYGATENMSVLDVRDCILDHTKPLASLTGYVSTGGMLDIGAAIKYAVAVEKNNAESDTGLDTEDIAGPDEGRDAAAETPGSSSADQDAGHGDGGAVGDTSDTVDQDKAEIKIPMLFKGLFEKIIKFGRRLF